MEKAFWDTSSLVPLCVQQPASLAVQELTARYQVVAWWATTVEMRSAFARLLRMGQLTADEYSSALMVLGILRRTWREIQPSYQLREQAEVFVDRFQLRATDALQLAAAGAWCMGRPNGRVFISGDLPLLEAARQFGFECIAG